MKDSECSWKDPGLCCAGRFQWYPEAAVRDPGLRWLLQHCREEAEFTAQFQPSSRFTETGDKQPESCGVPGGNRKEPCPQNHSSFLLRELQGAGPGGGGIPWDCDSIEREKSGGVPRKHLPVSQLLFQSIAGIPGSPNREHLTITMDEQADLLWKNRIHFVLHIQSAFLDKCHQGHS